MRVVSSPTIGSGPPFLSPRRVEVDEARGVAYVLDEQAIVAVQFDTGARQEIVSDFGELAGLALDLPNHRLFVSDTRGSIRTLDLATGASQFLSAGGSFGFAGGLAYDSVNARLLALDQGSPPFRLEFIDAGTGARRALAGAGILPVRPHSVAIDAERQVAFITEDAYDGVIAIDLESGYRQLIAK
jgi:hypothetical protein